MPVPAAGDRTPAGGRLPVGGGRNGARRGYRRGGSRRRRLLPVDRLGPCGAGDRGRLSLYFTFSDKFRKEYLPYTIELGRSFVQPSYQSRGNSKSIYALDNLWDGLGALVVLNPKVKYLFGKVTMYASYKAMARNALIWFLRRYFPDPDHLVAGKNPVQLDLDDPYYEHFFTGKTYEENYRILIQRIREFNENIPPLINAYMNLSPTMRVFDTVINTDFGGVEETGILLTIPDIYPEKKQRYMRWQGWRENLKQRREHFRLRLQEHLSRIRKRWEV